MKYKDIKYDLNDKLKDTVVKDQDGNPLILYHGTADDFKTLNRMFWASAHPKLANVYLDIRHDPSKNKYGHIIPVYMLLKNPLDGDELPGTVSIPDFIKYVLKQSHKKFNKLYIKNLIMAIKHHAKKEESGPYYQPINFWYDVETFFGPVGAKLIQGFLINAGFDGIKYTEQNQLTYGTFYPKNVFHAFGYNFQKKQTAALG